jgi:putative membrane protein
MILGHGILRASVTQWTAEPVTIALLVITSLVYAIGLRALWTHAGTGQGVHRWQAAAFYLGTLSLAIALLSPLAWLSDAVFSAHMAQHEILMLVSAPLLAMSQPLVVFLWAFRRSTRVAVVAACRGPLVGRAWRALTAPLAVFLLHAVAIWVWHIPVLYEWALGHQGVHALQHLSFVITAALFWWGMVHGRYGRAGYGVGVVYVFLTAVHSSLLGALATVADRVWYPSYLSPATEWRLDPLIDQQLAGLIMWVPSGVIFIVLGLALLAAWIGESERRANLSHPAALR